jgi:tetratricopeptide (TPR) repeat protein
MKCYNLALVYYNSKNFSEAIRWLEESYEIYSKDLNKDPKKQARYVYVLSPKATHNNNSMHRTLRLLASAYVLVENYEKASACTVLAAEEYEHPAASYLQLKLNFITGRYLISFYSWLLN